jgi:hypothetical protein
MDLEAALQLVLADVSASLNVVNREQVAQEAKRRAEILQALELSDPRGERLVEDVQQLIHDLHIDTVWPRCPLHGNHPMWLDHGEWTCPVANAPVVALGHLASLPLNRRE